MPLPLIIVALFAASSTKITWIERASDSAGHVIYMCPQARLGGELVPSTKDLLSLPPGYPLRFKPIAPGIARMVATDDVLYTIDGHGVLEVSRDPFVSRYDGSRQISLVAAADRLAMHIASEKVPASSSMHYRERPTGNPAERSFALEDTGCGAKLVRGNPVCPAARQVGKVESSRVDGPITIQECTLGPGDRLRQLIDGSAYLELELGRSRKVLSDRWEEQGHITQTSPGCSVDENDPAIRELTTSFIIGGFDVGSRTILEADLADASSAPH